MNQKNKDLIICFVITFIGIYGSIADYLTEYTILPSLWTINTKLDFTVFEREYEMSSIWFLFTMFGFMLITINVLNLKSKYRGKELLKHLKVIIGDKLNDGKNEYRIWTRNRNK